VTSRRSFLLDAVNEMRIEDLRAAWRKSDPQTARSAGGWPTVPREVGAAASRDTGASEADGAGHGGATAPAAPADAKGAAPPAPAKGPSRLEDVVSDAGFFGPAGERSRAYAEAWSLVWHLSRRRPEKFARLLQESRPAPFDAKSAPTRLEDFKRAFGDDLATIEREWRDDVARVLGPAGR
jgi:hypothetical protein